jgi:hypothetical protein
MAHLTRESIIQHSTFKKVEVDVTTEWGATDPDTGEPIPTSVFVKEMSARERETFEASLFTGRGKKKELNLIDGLAKYVIATACDVDGNLIFQPEDVKWLTTKPVRLLKRIKDAAEELNYGKTDEDEEDTLKN